MQLFHRQKKKMQYIRMTQKNISSSSKEVVFLPLVIFSCSLKTCVDIKFRTFSNNTYKKHLSNVYSCRNKCFYFSRLVDGKISLSISRSWYRPVRFFLAIGRDALHFQRTLHSSKMRKTFPDFILIDR